ncbi:hypothetical protein Bca4012_005878 [Brassica carinata]
MVVTLEPMEQTLVDAISKINQRAVAQEPGCPLPYISHTPSLPVHRPLSTFGNKTAVMAEQTEKAFLKQPKVFLSSKKSGKGKRPGKGGTRFWKNIGLGFKTPREAILDPFPIKSSALLNNQ